MKVLLLVNIYVQNGMLYMPFVACPMPAKMTAAIIICVSACETAPEVIKLFHEHEIYPAHKC